MDLPILYLGDEKVTIQSIKKATYKTNNALAVCAHLMYEDGTVEADRVSVSLPGSPFLAENEFFGEGNNRQKLLDALLSCGWIEATKKSSRSGYVVYRVYRLTDRAIIAESP